jgi:predicted nucleotide-binding protein
MSADLFTQINNVVLDLQSSDHQSYGHPLAKLSRLLGHAELADANRILTEGLDLDAFLAASDATQGSMVGSARLLWPDNVQEELGLKLLLIRKLGENDESDFAFQFSHTFFYAGNSRIISAIHAMNRQLIMPFVRDYKAYVLSQGQTDIRLVRPLSNRIFIVHGHDGEARETVARYLGDLGLEPVILHEQANRGRTIIEKVEANSDVSFAVVLLTPDDVGRAKDNSELEPRARQNVLLELGYFIAKLGRGNVCALRRGSVEIPSDFAGVVWEDFDTGGAWRQKLARELRAAGHELNWNKVMR